MLLKHHDLIDDIQFVHSKGMQDGKIAISARDITAKLSHAPAARLAFDHHLSETIRNTSIHVPWGVKRQNTVFATGKSILNRTSHTSIGALMLEYGGGGHGSAGTCQVDNEVAEDVLGALVNRINKDG